MSSRSLSSFFAACDDFRQSFGRGQELAEKRIIKLQTELSELEKAMWKESCIKLTRGPKKKHIEPYQTEWSCYKLFAYMFDIVWLCLQVANRNRWAFFHAFNFRERRVLTATDAKGKFALTNLLIYANYHKSGRTNARKLPFFFASFLRRMS